VRRVLPLLLLLVLASGCGSKSNATKSTSTADTTQSYVAAGNQVCIRSDKRIFAIGRLSRAPSGWAKTAAALQQKKIDTAAAAQFAAAKIQDKVHTAARAAGLTFCQQALTNWPA
jgi:hypothetical protein